MNQSVSILMLKKTVWNLFFLRSIVFCSQVHRWIQYRYSNFILFSLYPFFIEKIEWYHEQYKIRNIIKVSNPDVIQFCYAYIWKMYSFWYRYLFHLYVGLFCLISGMIDRILFFLAFCHDWYLIVFIFSKKLKKREI